MPGGDEPAEPADRLRLIGLQPGARAQRIKRRDEGGILTGMRCEGLAAQADEMSDRRIADARDLGCVLDRQIELGVIAQDRLLRFDEPMRSSLSSNMAILECTMMP